MQISGATSGVPANEVQNTSTNTSTTKSAPSPSVGDLRSLDKLQASTQTRRNSTTLPTSVSAELSAHMENVSNLFEGGAGALLRHGVMDGFASFPAEYRSLAQQTARLVGLMSEAPPPAGSAMPFPALEQRLDAVVSASSQLIDASTLNLESALQQAPEQRAAALTPHLQQLRDAGRVTAAGVAQMPVAELRANKEVVKEQLTTWAEKTEALHEQIKAQFGETHPTTIAALEARTDASAAYGKTMLRMAAANLGSLAFNMTLGPIASGLSRLFGSGS